MKQDIKKLAQGKRVFVGIDVHDKSWTVTALAEEELLFTHTIPGQWQALKQLLDPLRGSAQLFSAYEAGFSGFGLHDDLVNWGAKSIVVSPAHIPVVAGSRVKTDSKDSVKLAVCLAKGLLTGIFVPSKAARAQRQIMRTRKQMVNQRTRCKNMLKSMGHFHGVIIPKYAGLWQGAYLIRLRQVIWANLDLQLSANCHLDQIESLNASIAQLDARLKKMSQESEFAEKAKRIKTIPGVGPVVSMSFLLEIPQLEQFARGKELASYLGLTPGQYSSGEHVRMGGITRQGKADLRGLLVEASWVWVHKDPAARKRYSRLSATRGPKRAIVAMARKLALVIRAMLKNQEDYQTERVAA